jgi:predicted S18 family serine protease
MQRRSTEELCEVARAGGGITIYADTWPVDELVRIASSLEHGAALTLHGMSMRSVEELCKIASAAPGRVTFVG